MASTLGLDLDELLGLCAEVDAYYKPRQKPKADGTFRQIDCPTGRLKTVQRRLHRRLLATCDPSGVAHGGVKGRSHITAAQVHVGASSIGTLDIKGFFDSVSPDHVYSLLIDMGCSPDVARIVTQLTTFEGHLAQGSPASTAIANLLLFAFDQAVERAAIKQGVSVTRVVDDVVFSGARSNVKALLSAAMGELFRIRLRPNRKKIAVMSDGQRKTVCNLNVSSDVSLPKGASRSDRSKGRGLNRRDLRSRVRSAIRYGISETDRERLAGQLYYARKMHPDFAMDLLAKLKAAPDE